MKVRFLALLVLIGLLGCGGGGGAGVPSPFAGTFAGPWSGGGQSGTAQITVATSGGFAGSIVNTTLGLTGSTSGKIKSSGDLTGTVTYPGFLPNSMAGTVVLSNGGATLTGAIVMEGEATTFTLTRQ